jgi:hypothetical protein
VDHVRNQILREQHEIQPVGEWMNKHREEWNDYISRMTEDRIVWVIKDNSIKGGSSPGRPCKHCNYSLKPNYSEKGEEYGTKHTSMTFVQDGKTVISQV